MNRVASSRAIVFGMETIEFGYCLGFIALIILVHTTGLIAQGLGAKQMAQRLYEKAGTGK